MADFLFVILAVYLFAFVLGYQGKSKNK